MKFRLAALAAILPILFSCNGKEQQKDLVVWFSLTGNTDRLAHLFSEKLGADELRLECEEAYPEIFEEVLAIAGPEIKEGFCRPLKNASVDLSKYKTIYIGFPVWHGTFPPPVNTFLSVNDLSSKNVVLFCTYGSGGVKSSTRAFREMAPDAEFLGAYGIASRRIEAAPAEVDAFLASMGKETEGEDADYCEPRPVADSDLALFSKASEGYAYLNLEPLMVSTGRGAEGEVFVFTCNISMRDMPPSRAEVTVVVPDAGKPYLKSVER